MAGGQAGKGPGGELLTEGVYRGLREAILLGRYRPNQRLVEVEVAEDLGASRTPVREALQRLGSEGLIVRGRRGWVVREFSKDEIREIYEVRLALEGYAARLAAERATPAQIETIGELGRVRTAEGMSRELLVQVNDRFHSEIVAAAGNQRLVENIHRNQTYYFNQRIAGLYTDAQANESLDEHVALVTAVRERDGDRAEAIIRRHIRRALDILMDRLV